MHLLLTRTFVRSVVLLVCAITLVALSGCDSNSPQVEEDQDLDPNLTPNNETPGDPLETAEQYTLSNGTITVTTHVDGTIRDIRHADADYNEPWPTDAIVQAGFSSPWFFAETDQPRAAVPYGGNWPLGSVGLSSLDSGQDPGFFLVEERDLVEPVSNWPVALGAPSTPDGQPLLLGDRMVWGHFIPGQSSTAPSALSDVHVGMTMYLFDDAPDDNVLFLRFDVTNRGSATIQDLNSGFYSDIEVGFTGLPFWDQCQIGHRDNGVGYDADQNLSFSYIIPRDPTIQRDEECFGNAAGFLFIDAPGGDVEPLANAYVTRDEADGPVEFRETNYLESINIGNVLQGRTAAGDPMIDPTTNQEMRFAFSGDPIAGTGWLDHARDTRNLLSLRPFSLGSGETKSFTVAWIMIQNRADLAMAMTDLQDQAERILADRESYLPE